MRTFISVVVVLQAAVAFAQHGSVYARPDAIVDLKAREGVELLNGQWRYADARIIEVDHRAAGADLKPSGDPIRTHDISPQAGATDFDDSKWETIAPTALEARRATGKLSFNWYRIRLTIPDKIADFNTAGSTAIVEIVVDDYAEVWANGKLSATLGQSGAGVVRGFNAPNRVVLTRDACPGEQFTIAIFGANGPLSQPPGNFIWIRSATLDFYAPGRAPGIGEEVAFDVERLSPEIDQLIPRDARMYKIVDSIGFAEGPVWVPGTDGVDGHLLFSDPNNNTIYRWSTDGQLNVFRTKSGYAGFDIAAYRQPGSNGLALDPEGRLTICEHGNRRVTRLETNGVITVLTDRFEGKRLNSPNDLVYHSDGTLYFTDPYFGLPNLLGDPRKELPYSGVFCLTRDGQLRLVSTELLGPNGLAFSPDERFLYVANWDDHKKIVVRYDVARDGSLTNGTVFFDMTSAAGEEALDGLKVDRKGNLYVSGPGGVWMISPSAKHLGTLKAPQLPANMAWGDADGRTLYLAARSAIYRLRLSGVQ